MKQVCLSNRLLDLFHTDRNVQLQQFYSGMAVPVFRSGWTMLNNRLAATNHLLQEGREAIHESVGTVGCGD